MNFQPIFWGGLIAGTLDIVAACVLAWLRGGTSPVRVLQFIASGLLGAASFQDALLVCSLSCFVLACPSPLSCAAFRGKWALLFVV